MPSTRRSRLAHCILIATLTSVLTGCAVAPPRTDDPLQNFNRRMFALNRVADKVAIRPVAKAYVKVTGPKERVLIGNFFANLRAPVTIINEVLQGRPEPALQSTGRFVINSTVGFLGFFDPASEMRLPAHPTDFGVTLRASALPIDPVIDSSYDPYAFMRDAYRQHRLYEIYYGNPPLAAIEQLQGTSPGENNDADIDQLLQQQQQYEKTHGINNNAAPASAGSVPAPA